MTDTHSNTMEAMARYRMLEALRCQEHEIRYQIRELVTDARIQGDTWASIAQALGTTTQAAWARFAHPEGKIPEAQQEQLPID